jgi:hypothetical protein
MKNRLNVTSDCFLAQHTFTAFRDNPYFPSVMLRMSDADGHACHFLTDDGCMIYEDRPISCRTYPLERAVARTGTNENRMDCYFIARHAYCLGHNETRKWTVEEWIEDQRIQKYNAMNNLWVEIDTLFRSKPWRERELNNPALKMAFMACFNVDRFKVFVCESTFFSRFEVSPEKIERIMNSDVELMKLGFDWIKFFLRSTGPLKLKSGNTRFEETLQRHS